MDERWTTVTLVADGTKPHDGTLRWLAGCRDAGIERIRILDADADRRGGADRGGADRTGVAEGLRGSVERMLPDVQVDVLPSSGSVTTTLAAESDETDCIVIGAERTRRGSTAAAVPARVAEHSTVPVVVVPDGPHPVEGDVVLAVDEPVDERAVTIAVEEARRRHRRVTLLRAWQMPVLTRTGLTDFAEEPLRWRSTNAELLHRVTAELTARFPDVRFHPLLVEGRPGHAVASHTRRASLVVLGCGHAHAFSASVLHDVLRETVSPVCVVPARTSVDAQPTRSRRTADTRFVR